MEHAHAKDNTPAVESTPKPRAGVVQGVGIGLVITGAVALLSAPAVKDWPSICTAIFVYGSLCCAGAVAALAAA